MKSISVNSHSVTIFIAGDIAAAKQICREFCFSAGLCVSVDAVEFIYTGGAEAGVRVGLINYPRFPAAPADIDAMAMALGERLMIGLCQKSYSVVGPVRTIWVSRRAYT